MTTLLSAADFEQVIQALDELYDLCPLDEFPARVLGLVPRLIGSDLASYNEINPALDRAVFDTDHDRERFASFAEIFDRHLNEHPLITHYQQTGDGRALKISDFLTQQAFHRLGIYSEFFRPLGVEHQLVVTLPSGPRSLVIGLALNRSKPDFSERDRTLLELLRPHLARAYANSTILSSLRDQLELLRNGRADNDAPDDRIAALTARERTLLALVAHGLTNKEIAGELGIATATVKKHLEHVYAKLGVRTRTAALAHAGLTFVQDELRAR